MVDKVLTYSARLHTQFCEVGFIATYKSQVMSSRDAFILVFAACRRARTVSACKTEEGGGLIRAARLLAVVLSSEGRGERPRHTPGRGR